MSFETPTPRRRIFVGDVHGCGDELDLLLDRLAFVADHDALYFVGDLICRGTQNRRALEIAEAHASGLVLGNHEYWLLRRGFFGPGELDPDEWPDIADLARDPDRTRFGAWIAGWPLVLDLEDAVLVHAALPPSLWQDDAEELGRWARLRLDATCALSEAELFVLHTRHCDAQGRRPAQDWPPPEPSFRPWHEFYAGTRTVVFGHWARRGLVLRERVRGLDSGCVYGGELSAWVAETDEIVQVPARRRYWPR